MGKVAENNPAISYIKTRMKRGKIVSVEDAVRVIRDGDTLALDGFIGFCAPEELIIGLEKRFLETGEPKNLTLVYASGIGAAACCCGPLGINAEIAGTGIE